MKIIKSLAGIYCGLASYNGKYYYASGYTHFGVIQRLARLIETDNK